MGITYSTEISLGNFNLPSHAILSHLSYMKGLSIGLNNTLISYLHYYFQMHEFTWSMEAHFIPNTKVLKLYGVKWHETIET